MVNEYFTVTNYHLNIAKQYGEKVAQHQREEGHTEADEPWLEHSQDEIIFLVTGEKEHDVDESYLIIDAFEEGYYREEGWEI